MIGRNMSRIEWWTYQHRLAEAEAKATKAEGELATTRNTLSEALVLIRRLGSEFHGEPPVGFCRACGWPETRGHGDGCLIGNFLAKLDATAPTQARCPHCGATTTEKLDNGAIGCSTCFKMWEPDATAPTEGGSNGN